MAHNTRKLVGVILMLSLLVAALAAFTIPSAAADGQWELVTDASTLKAGDQIVIASNTKGVVATSTVSSSYLTNATATFSSDKKTITSLPSNAGIFTLGGSAGSWTLTADSGKLLGATAVKKVALGSGETTWSISISSNNATIQNGNSTYGRFLYNVSSPRFTTYTSNTSASMLLPQIYRFVESSSGDNTCAHTNTNTVTVDANCTTAGSTTVTCNDCGVTVSTTEIKALGHEGGEATCTALAVCTRCGEEYGDFAEHNYVGGVCDVCGEKEATELTTKYVFADYADGVQYAEGEVHVLDDVVTVTSTQCHFTTQLRIYSSSTHNGVAFIKSTRTISKIVLNAGYKVDTLNVYGSTDGTTWNLIQAVSVTSTSYNDYTVSIDPNLKYKQLKLDVAGEQQIRVANFTLTTVSDSAEVHTHVFDNGVVTAPTCFTKGYTTYTCTATGCGYSYTDDETDATGHSCVDGWCTVCGHAEPDTFLTIPDAKNFADLLNGKESPAKYYMTVIVDEVTDTDWGNMNVKDSEGNTFVIYGLYSADGKTRYDAMETKPVVGDVITVYGIIVRYDASTYEMKNAWVTDIHEHVYDTAEVVVVEDVPFVSYKCACGDAQVKNVATFKGASIRYKAGATVEQLAVRFGYQFDPNVIEYIVGWSWDYEAIDGNAVISGTVDGTAITEAGVSNLVFTDIPTKRIDGTFKVTLTLVLEIDGTEYTYTEAEANVRVISEVLAAIAGDTTETQEARDYAQDVLDAFNELPDDDEPAVVPTKEEDENN